MNKFTFNQGTREDVVVGLFALAARLVLWAANWFMIGRQAVGANDWALAWTFIGMEVISAEASRAVDLLTLVGFA
jgi:hypothetical protein